MTTRKRNLIIAAVAAIVIAAAAVITVVTLNTQSEAEKVNNALALMSSPDNTDSDVSYNRNAAVTVGGGSDNDTPIIIDETEDTVEADNEDVLDENADVSMNDNDNTEKEDTPDDGATSSEPSGSTKPTDKPVDISKPDYPEAPNQDKDSAPASTKAQTNKPAVTVVTTAPAVTAPPSTVRDDLPKVTAEPKYTTVPTEKPAQTEPTVVEKTDSNGFPANPVDGQFFIDSDGNRWEYIEFVGWVPANGDGVMQEFPDFYVEGGDEVILS